MEYEQGVQEMSPEPLKLFYCYAHVDAKLRKRLDDHLALLKREGVISEWHDGDVSAGQQWEEEIHQHLEDAHLILLLISSSFLASDYCYDTEMQKALERQETGTARVIPIILRECDWKIAPFRKLQALPSNGKPVTMWRDKDAAFADIARGIREIADASGFIRERQEAFSKGSPSQVFIPQTVATSLEFSEHTLSPESCQKLAAYLQQQQARHTSVLASGSRSLRVHDVISDTNLFISPVWKDEGGSVVSEGLIEVYCRGNARAKALTAAW
jgi:hypothetical protein